MSTTKRVGILYGRERTFPEAFCDEVNRRNKGVVAEPVKLSHTDLDLVRPFDVVVDRISHEVPFYQVFVKQLALMGVKVVNSPFWKLADDKYFGNCLAQRLGIAVPKTVALPQKEYIEDITQESLTNLELVDWNRVVEHVGLPCFIKPCVGGGWKGVSRCDSLDELMRHYDRSGTAVMMVQEGIQWDGYARLICIGRQQVWVAPWDPTLPHHERYTRANFDFSEDLVEKMREQAVRLNQALGYDMNTVEFAVRDGVPYAIDFTNSSPDLDRNSLTEEAFEWSVVKMADLAITAASEAPKDLPPRFEELI